MSRLQLHIVFCRSRMPASGGRISAFSAASHGLHFTCRLQLLHMSPAATAVQLHFHMQAMNLIPALICEIHAQPSTEFARRVQKVTCQR
ncbi:hypothetical protein V6N11_001869 [Hibiscus sabdariffa]|uniref:Secreted protein n=1 Tax=Hibiscus sabdariffa TaxID=183260 RepID=A0ABR2QU38_9ROSI